MSECNDLVPLRPNDIDARLGVAEVGENRPLVTASAALPLGVVCRFELLGLGTCRVCLCRIVVDAGSCCDNCCPDVTDVGEKLFENLEGLTVVFVVVSKADDFAVMELWGGWALLFKGKVGDPRSTGGCDVPFGAEVDRGSNKDPLGKYELSTVGTTLTAVPDPAPNPGAEAG